MEAVGDIVVDIDKLGEAVPDNEGVIVVDVVGVADILGAALIQELGSDVMEGEGLAVGVVVVLAEWLGTIECDGVADVDDDDDGTGDGLTHRVATMSVMRSTSLSKSLTNVYNG